MMKYADFVSYVEKIVLYQSQNKKFRHFSIKRKCTLNLTIRQLSVLTKKSKSTVHRWIKRMEGEGLIYLGEEIRAKRDVGNKFYNDMKFYVVKKVLAINRAKARLRAFKYLEKIEKLKSGTLKIFLFHKNNKTKKIKLVNSISSSYFMLQGKGVQFELGERVDLRTKSLESLSKFIEKERLSSFLINLLDTIS